MGVVDDILKPYGLKYEDLKPEEHLTLTQWIDAADSKKITPEKTRGFLRSLILTVEQELISTDEFDYIFFGLFKRRNWRQVILKARLQNYLMLETIFLSPTQAKQDMAASLMRLSDQIKAGKK